SWSLPSALRLAALGTATMRCASPTGKLWAVAVSGAHKAARNRNRRVMDASRLFGDDYVRVGQFGRNQASAGSMPTTPSLLCAKHCSAFEKTNSRTWVLKITYFLAVRRGRPLHPHPHPHPHHRWCLQKTCHLHKRRSRLP